MSNDSTVHLHLHTLNIEDRCFNLKTTFNGRKNAMKLLPSSLVLYTAVDCLGEWSLLPARRISISNQTRSDPIYRQPPSIKMETMG